MKPSSALHLSYNLDPSVAGPQEALKIYPGESLQQAIFKL